MSASWSTPDPRRPTGLVLSAPPPERTAPPLVEDVKAGVMAVVVSVLVGAPVGLLWSAVAPRVDVVLTGEQVSLATPGTDAFIAGDGTFLFVTAVAGVVGGLVAWVLARRHGPAVVLGLAAGGLLAAVVAMRVGQAVGADDVAAAVRAAQTTPFEITLRLRAREALVGWPVGALTAFVAASLLRRSG